MDKLVKLAAFELPQQLSVLRSRLESEGISCFVMDEFTVQVDNFLSNAVGGVKLFVRESDLDDAKQILKDSGFNVDEDTGALRSLSRIDLSLQVIDRLASIIPIVSGLKKPEQRFVAVLLLVAILVSAVISTIGYLLS